MEVVYINSIEDIKNYGELSIAHGFFDGVHIAHQKLINEAKTFANEKCCLTGVVTFDKKKLYENNKQSFLSSLSISTLDRRLELFEFFGIDIVFVIKFDNFKHLSDIEYIKQIIIPIGTKNFVMGNDNCFGKGGMGNSTNIHQYASDCFSVNVVDLLIDCGDKVSSTNIKQYIMKEDISISNHMLGYYYSLNGGVVKGKQLGRQIGYPTANLKINDMVIIPQVSVYATLVKIDGVIYKSMTNVGYNPTTDFREELSVETHIFNFDENIYGKEIALYFISKIRSEKKFSSVEHLLQQLEKDGEKVLEVLENIDFKKVI